MLLAALLDPSSPEGTNRVLSAVPDTSLTGENGLTDYAYGDVREAISGAAVLLSDINEHCFGGGAGIDMNCIYYPQQDTAIKVLGGYGLQGTIQVKEGRDAITLADVKFCSLPPDGTQGLKDPRNKAFMQSAEVGCGRARRSEQPTSPLPPRHPWGVDPEQHAQDVAAARALADARGASGAGGARRGLLQSASLRFDLCTQHSECDQTTVAGGEFSNGNTDALDGNPLFSSFSRL
ncbi:hypothetical protein T484DRAFT_1841746 [Baffinella frigidus]|nr:hypothetical protein T484DRAFT_1841746 [Cryptophyta sp. CCMP2293]